MSPQKRAVSPIPSDRRHLLIPERLAPITGAMLAHFAAWIDDPFRTYDYYAGIYDGLRALDRWRCSTCAVPATLGELTRGWPGGPSFKPSTDAGEILTIFLRAERMSEGLPALPAGGGQRAGRQPGGQLPTIFDALTRRDRCRGPDGHPCLADCSFSTFVDALHERGYSPVSDYGNQILSRGDDWWAPLALGVSDRLENLHDGLTEPSPWLGRVRLASSLASGYYYWSSQNSYIVPNSIARLPGLHFVMPYLVFGPTNERRVDIGLLQAGPCRGRLCLVVDVSARGGALNDKALGAFQPGAQWAADGHLGLKLRNLHWTLSSLQVAAGRSIPYLDGFRQDNSVELDAGLLFDRFRVGVGSSYSSDCASFYFVMGLNDLSGWATTLF